MAHLSSCLPLSRDSVIEAHKIILPNVHRTPVLTNKTLTQLASQTRLHDDQEEKWRGRPPASPVIRLWFKCENFQRIGAFKARGAFHAVERLKQEPGWLESGGKEKGVVTHSSGNHAQALALAAQASGIPAYIVMPRISLPQKIAATKGYGAKVFFSGSTSTEREAVARQVMQETGARLIPPYDHPDIILGQGTLGLELQEQVLTLMVQEDLSESKALSAPNSRPRKGLDAILAPCGGGGMLSGVALSCEGTGIKVFGTEPEFEGADDAKRGYESGIRVESVSSLTVADGLRTPVGQFPWGIIYDRKLVAGFYAATENEIKAALKLVLERFKLVIEPSAAVPLAVALFNEDFRRMVEDTAGLNGWDVGIVFSGGNISIESLGQLFS